MKVLDLQCTQGHAFEGWFSSEDDFQSQLARQLVECPLCGDRAVAKLPSAPRLNLSGAGSVLDLTRPQTALVALLMLRGPQTAYELLSRSERMAKFDSVGDVQYALERLAQHQPPLVRLLGRQSGQREDRYGHLLSGEPVWNGSVSAAGDETGGGAAQAQSAVLDRLEALEAKVAQLEARLEAAGA